MELEKIFTNKELSIRLKELGVTQKGETFWWKKPYKIQSIYDEKTGITERKVLEYEHVLGGMYGWNANAEDLIARAFYVDELLKLLPKKLKDKEFNGHSESEYRLTISASNNYEDNDAEDWTIEYYAEYFDIKDYAFSDIKLADALAKMLVHLLKNKIMEFKNENL